ncbi:MAG: acyl-protein synthetase [Myxococcales bacterium]|nr:acyl-protein synthetase [Myxococcales bacterium]MDD9967174.1 acyl-protein synthetase [Myxococcales bacterium]
MMAGDQRALEPTRAALQTRIADLIARLSDGSRDDEARDVLLEEVLAWQAQAVPPYARLCQRHRSSSPASRVAACRVLEFPALPTDVFRFTRVASHLPSQDVRTFRTSGTTSGARGQHFVRDLSLYDQAARAAARYALFPDQRPMRIVAVMASGQTLPDSSLSYMVDRFFSWFGDGYGGHVWSAAGLDTEALVGHLDAACRDGAAVALLGTSFGLVHADDALGTHRERGRSFRLPQGSRVMQTGGFKGKSRELSPSSMQAMLCERYGVPTTHVVQEYGMTELCSQAYGSALRSALLGGEPQPSDGRRLSPCAQSGSHAQADAGEHSGERLWVPGWVRTTAVDAETLAPVPDGQPGLLRIDDLANLDTVCAIQTSDLARVTPDGLQLLGRAPGAAPRGCSLAVEEVLGHR